MDRAISIYAGLGWAALIVVLAVAAFRPVKDQPPFGQDDEALAALVSRRDMSEDEASRIEAVRAHWARYGCTCGCGDAA